MRTTENSEQWQKGTVFWAVKVSSAHLRATWKKAGDLSCLCNGQLGQFNLTLKNAPFRDLALFLPVCECPRVCGLCFLGMTRSRLHHQHKYSANSCSWWEQSGHVSQHTWHLSHYVPACLLQCLPRGQHCCLSLAWAGKGKILLSSWQRNTAAHQRQQCFLNCIP